MPPRPLREATPWKLPLFHRPQNIVPTSPRRRIVIKFQGQSFKSMTIFLRGGGKSMGGEQCSQGHRTNSRCRFYGFWVYTPMVELPSMPCSTLPVGKADIEERVASARRGDQKSREAKVSAVAGQCPPPYLATPCP